MSKQDEKAPPKEVTEIIETSLSELDLLTRAFDLIAQVCETENLPHTEEKELTPTPAEESEGETAVIVH